MGWKGKENNMRRGEAYVAVYYSFSLYFQRKPISSSLLPYKRYLSSVAIAMGWLMG